MVDIRGTETMSYRVIRLSEEIRNFYLTHVHLIIARGTCYAVVAASSGRDDVQTIAARLSGYRHTP